MRRLDVGATGAPDRAEPDGPSADTSAAGLRSRRRARVLLLATARPEFTPPGPARSNLTTVQLARLTKRQARDMVERRAGKGRQAGTPAPLEQQAKSEEGKS